jgi:hypothetical protein
MRETLPFLISYVVFQPFRLRFNKRVPYSGRTFETVSLLFNRYDLESLSSNGQLLSR